MLRFKTNKKYVLFILAIGLYMSGCAATSTDSRHTDSVSTGKSLPVPVKDNYNIYYEQIVEVDKNFKQDDLFLRTKQWVAQNYTATAFYKPIQFEDKENGLIIVRIYFTYSIQFFIHQADYKIYCVGKIQVKDGKYKYTFSDFTYVCSSTNRYYVEKEPKSCEYLIHQHELRTPSSGTYTKALHGLDEGMKKVIASLHNSLLIESDAF